MIVARRDGDVLELSVEDDGAGIREDAVLTKGHGLENTRERLQTLYGDRATLAVAPAPAQGTIARLRLPFRELLLEARQNDESNDEFSDESNDER